MVKQTKKTLVIYKSNYGSTKRYAEWISDDVNADLVEASMIRVSDLQKYDIIVFGGFLHAVGISGIKIIKNNFKYLHNKKVIVFTVGCSPDREDSANHVISNNFTDDMKDRVSFFYLRGAFNYRKLNFFDKMMMILLKLKLKRLKEEELDEDSRGLLECYDNPIEWTDRRAIIPIVECIKE